MAGHTCGVTTHTRGARVRDTSRLLARAPRVRCCRRGGPAPATSGVGLLCRGAAGGAQRRPSRRAPVRSGREHRALNGLCAARAAGRWDEFDAAGANACAVRCSSACGDWRGPGGSCGGFGHAGWASGGQRGVGGRGDWRGSARGGHRAAATPRPPQCTCPAVHPPRGAALHRARRPPALFSPAKRDPVARCHSLPASRARAV